MTHGQILGKRLPEEEKFLKRVLAAFFEKKARPAENLGCGMERGIESRKERDFKF